ncbi:MAG: type III-B CRISPR module-associated protein Cmr5 [Pseudonocardiaceae bacterium]
MSPRPGQPQERERQVRRIDQDGAAAAAGLLDTTLDAKRAKELRTRYRQLRAMLHSAGLAATYAFVAARTASAELGESYRKVAEALRRRLTGRGLLTGDPATMTPADVLGQLGGMDVVAYARASAEAAALLGWLSRLADATYQQRDGA